MLRFMKSTTLVMAIVLILSVAGVSATWKYAIGTPQSVLELLGITLDEFNYKVEEILPGTEEDKSKSNHLLIIENLLEHDDRGLNQDPKQVIENAMKSQDILYCEVNSISGGNLKKLFLDGTNSANVRFMIVKASATEFDVYTYSANPVEEEVYGVTEIVTYKTVLTYGAHVDEETGKTVTEWYVFDCHPGYAVVINPHVNQVRRSVDYTRWRHM